MPTLSKNKAMLALCRTLAKDRVSGLSPCRSALALINVGFPVSTFELVPAVN